MSEQSSLRSPRAPDRSSPPPPPRKRESPGQQHNVRLQPQGQSLSAVTKLQHQKWLRRGHGHVGHAEATRTSRSSALSTQGVSRQKEARARRWAHAIWGTVSAVSKTISEDLNPKGQRERRLLKTQTPRALRPRGLEASIGRHRKVLLEARQTPGEGEAIGGPQEAARKVRKIIHSASKAENPLLKTAGRAEASGNARLREPREMADPSNRTIRVAAETRQLGTPGNTISSPGLNRRHTFTSIRVPQLSQVRDTQGLGEAAALGAGPEEEDMSALSNPHPKRRNTARR